MSNAFASIPTMYSAERHYNGTQPQQKNKSAILQRRAHISVQLASRYGYLIGRWQHDNDIEFTIFRKTSWICRRVAYEMHENTNQIDSEDRRPVFIIGGSRTGSTMLKTILTTSREISLADEMLLLCPWWLRKDVATHIKENVGSLDAPDALDRLLQLLYSGKPHGWFWSESERLLDRDLMERELSERPLTIQNIFHAILVVHAKMRGKDRIGAKFPTHYSYTDKLLEWYPDCLLLHTTRNPKAVYASQAKKYVSTDQSWVSRSYMRFRQFVHINIQITWTARLHEKLCKLPNYRLVRYEDLVLNPDAEIRKICEFLGITYLPEMLAPKRYGSSYDKPGIVGEGIEQASLERWRSSIHPMTAKFVDVAHKKAMRLFGYGV